MTFIEGKEDMAWLAEKLRGVKLPPELRGLEACACAYLVGNEDCPSVIVLYEHNHVNSLRWGYRWDAEKDLYVRDPSKDSI